MLFYQVPGTYYTIHLLYLSDASRTQNNEIRTVYIHYITTWGIKTNKKKRHAIEHTSWNMVNGVTHDHMVLIAVYAAERQDLRSSWSRRGAWDAIISASRVDDDMTKYVNMGAWALRELCVGFRLHHRLSYRLSTFWCFDTITIIIVIVIVIEGFLGLSYRNAIWFDIQH